MHTYQDTEDTHYLQYYYLTTNLYAEKSRKFLLWGWSGNIYAIILQDVVLLDYAE